MEIKVSDQDIEDLAMLEVTFNPRKVTRATWVLFMASFRKFFWTRNVSNDLNVVAANDALVDMQSVEGQGSSNGGTHSHRGPASK